MSLSLLQTRMLIPWMTQTLATSPLELRTTTLMLRRYQRDGKSLTALLDMGRSSYSPYPLLLLSSLSL